jgi:hypothetical protein
MGRPAFIPQRHSGMANLASGADLVEQGLHLLLVRGLVARQTTAEGFGYHALDTAGSVVSSLQTPYSQDLRERAAWTVERFAKTTTGEVATFFRECIGRFGEEFTLTSPGWEDFR